MEKATIKDLISRKLQRDNAKPKYYDIEVKSLGKAITLKHPSDEMRLNMMEEMGAEPDMRTTIEAYKHLIYDCCPLLHDRELQEELEIKDPYDTVDAIFDLDDITEIGEQLMDKMGEPIENDIKN